METESLYCEIPGTVEIRAMMCGPEDMWVIDNELYIYIVLGI